VPQPTTLPRAAIIIIIIIIKGKNILIVKKESARYLKPTNHSRSRKRTWSAKHAVVPPIRGEIQTVSRISHDLYEKKDTQDRLHRGMS
jgi:hypothetical protein